MCLRALHLDANLRRSVRPERAEDLGVGAHVDVTAERRRHRFGSLYEVSSHLTRLIAYSVSNSGRQAHVFEYLGKARVYAQVVQRGIDL
jgi:hypothetical protein